MSGIAGALAAELHANEAVTRRAGLLHDIGKAVDFEMEGTHTAIGVGLARKYHESPEVIHAIAAHHEDEPFQSVEAVLVYAGDSISAARPGARRESLEGYIKRLDRLEKIARVLQGRGAVLRHPGGREVRILVKPEELDDGMAAAGAGNRRPDSGIRSGVSGADQSDGDPRNARRRIRPVVGEAETEDSIHRRRRGPTRARRVRARLKHLVARHQADFVIANGENAAGGLGLTWETAQELFDAGVHVLTTGNHVWRQREAAPPGGGGPARVLRPANYPSMCPGRGSGVFLAPGGGKVGVLNIIGRTFMEPLDCPFLATDREIPPLQERTKVVVVDMHAEATSEKIALGWYLEGRASAVLGTHTHVPTADEHVLPGGTAYITDVGMTGPRDSVLGVSVKPVINRFRTGMPHRFELATGPVLLSAVVVDIDEGTGSARGVSCASKKSTRRSHIRNLVAELKSSKTGSTDSITGGRRTQW